MPLKPGETVRGKEVTDSMRKIVQLYKEAKDTIEAMERFFEVGLEATRCNYNPFDCGFRETYISNGGDIYRCRLYEDPNTPFERCKDCSLDRCELTTK